MKKARTAMTLALATFAAVAMAQDPVKLDPKHYKVEFENDQVRVLRVKYGGREKSVMHEHPNSVEVWLTDGNVKFETGDGKTHESKPKAGRTSWARARQHQPENESDEPFELILVEMKK